MEFKIFKLAVAKQFERMSQHGLFRVNVTKDEMWTTYLAAFPVGSDPIYKERTEHDCQCCKQFIRTVGDVVSIIDGKIVSIWDITIPAEPEYQSVANALSDLVKSKAISDVFYHYEGHAGTDKNHFQSPSGVGTFEHFFLNIPQQFVMKESDIASKLGLIRSSKDVFQRALDEITKESVEIVLELIAQNSLYRGTEHEFVLSEFKKLKAEYTKIKQDKSLFAWSKIKDITGAVSGIRSSVIGSLLVDLSEDKELEAAVGSFEAKVAPTNYKRPTALVTKAMIAKAKKTIDELGLNSALERRYATIDDITINNILFADRSTKKILTGDVFDELSDQVSVKSKSLDKVEEVSIEKFLSDILPRAESIEIMLENQHTSNLVTLVAPVDPTAKNMFKWDNKFSWSYTGGVADSIKERVKKAGGNVTGEFCCRLAWDYTDDLDFHMYEQGGSHIYFSNRRSLSRNGGMLDVDANGVDGQREDPCENIFYEKISKMSNGTYELKVHNYSRRSDGVGFEIEIDILGQIYNLSYPKVLKSSETISIGTFTKSASGLIFIPNKNLTNAKSTKQVWGIHTNTFQKVNVVMNSPNHWDGNNVGNKHYFFMLENCINDGTVRGFYNEFLVSTLDEHRKVIEQVGAKMQTEKSDQQLSGVGFSSTQRNKILCRVTGNFTRLVKIVF